MLHGGARKAYQPSEKFGVNWLYGRENELNERERKGFWAPANGAVNEPSNPKILKFCGLIEVNGLNRNHISDRLRNQMSPPMI